MWISDGYKYELIGTSEGCSKVCVECFTYNQVDYIADALDGILEQKTSFAYHILIIDDASSDGTSDIIREYASKYKNRIVALIAQKNTYGSKAVIDIHANIQKEFSRNAKYVATCEGDDYWIDENKLQLQVNYMDAHPKCMMYLHNSYWLDCSTGDKKIANPFDADMERELTAEEMISLENKHPATASRLYRKDIWECPNYVKECSVGDYSKMLYAMSLGSVHYSNRIMCVYRFMSNNSTTKMLNTTRYRMYHHLGVLIFLNSFDEKTQGKYHDFLKYKKNEYAYSIAFFVAKDRSVEECWHDAKQSYYLNNTDKYIPLLDNLRKYGDKMYVGQSLRSYIERHKKIVVMGTGEVGKMVAEQMKNNGIEFSGFVVTAKKNEELLFMGKKIWSLSDYPFGMNDIGVIIAIMPKNNDGVVESLKSEEVNDYIWAYDCFMQDLFPVGQKSCQ